MNTPQNLKDQITIGEKMARQFHLMSSAELHLELQRIAKEREGLSPKYNAGHIGALEVEKQSILKCIQNRLNYV